MLKQLTIFVFLLFLSTFSYSQTDSAHINATILTTDKGLYLTTDLSFSFSFSKKVSVDPRVGYAFTMNDYDYFYIQQGVVFNGKKVAIGLYPVWLRRYSKDIGYQTPSSIMLKAKTFKNIEVIFWTNYWYNLLEPSIQIIFPLKALAF